MFTNDLLLFMKVTFFASLMWLNKYIKIMFCLCMTNLFELHICNLDYLSTLSDQIKAFWRMSSLALLTLLQNIIMHQVRFLQLLFWITNSSYLDAGYCYHLLMLSVLVCPKEIPLSSFFLFSVFWNFGLTFLKNCIEQMREAKL
jgi:hypothetical protein